mmetsp:Transcript_50557/g.146714  ORF Transcript_50557/g.146714 Transcript_50557/m.146714 type:complete len:391 (+) Transcript_50557:457-1629(+)
MDEAGVCLELGGRELNGPLVLLHSGQGNDQVGPEVLPGVLQRKAVLPHGGEHHLHVRPQVLRRKTKGQPVLPKRWKDDLGQCPQLQGHVLERKAVLLHGNQDHLQVCLELWCRVLDCKPVLLHRRQHNLPLRAHLPGQQLQGHAALAHGGQGDLAVCAENLGREADAVPILPHRGEHDRAVAAQLVGGKVERVAGLLHHGVHHLVAGSDPLWCLLEGPPILLRRRQPLRLLPPPADEHQVHGVARRQAAEQLGLPRLQVPAQKPLLRMRHPRLGLDGSLHLAHVPATVRLHGAEWPRQAVHVQRQSLWCGRLCTADCPDRLLLAGVCLPARGRQELLHLGPVQGQGRRVVLGRGVVLLHAACSLHGGPLPLSRLALAGVGRGIGRNRTGR